MKMIPDRTFALEAFWRIVALWIAVVHVIVMSAAASATAAPSSGEQFSLQQALSLPITANLVAAKDSNRIAWVLDERGVRNVWGAEGPAWVPHSLTQFSSDDGKEISDLLLSADGSLAVFVRNEGHGNWSSPTEPNPASLPVVQKAEIWAAPFRAGRARKLAEGTSPVFSSPAFSPTRYVGIYKRVGGLCRALSYAWIPPLLLICRSAWPARRGSWREARRSASAVTRSHCCDRPGRIRLRR